VAHVDTDENALESIPGIVMIHVVPQKVSVFPLVYGGVSVVILCWATRWARKRMRRADYYELDASFRAARGYAFVIVMAVISNCDLSLGLVLTPTKRTVSYELFWIQLDLSQKEINALVY
jgi:hypothetical protein